jgi:hypothetical protein
VTAYVSLDNESNGITVPPASTKRPADEAAASLNANDVLMLHRRLKMIQQRTAEVNKATLEAEKERDEFHNQIEQIEEQLHPKRDSY